MNPNAVPQVQWQDIVAAGGVDPWIDAELKRRGLRESVDTSKLNDAEKKLYKARREEEGKVKRELKKLSWAAYKRAHLVHVGAGVFYHDTVDHDRFDLADLEERLKANGLPELKDAEALAKALEITIPRLRWLVFHREVDSGTHYRRWRIPKRSGGERLISAPKHDLKRCQKWIATSLVEHLPVHGAAHGFLIDRSIKTNALVHARSKVVIKLDLKDFYPSITLPRVKGLFRKAGYNEQVATLLALLCTESPRDEMVIRGKTFYVATGPRSLPQGAPTSPSITNALCLKLDLRLAGLAQKLGLHYTRYADDLTFSFKQEPPQKKAVARLLRAVEEIAGSEGFKVHQDKTRVMRSGARQSVTGLVVNAAAGRPLVRVPREFVRELRAAIKNRELGREGHGEPLAVLRGRAAHVYMADPVKGREFLERIGKLEARQATSGGGER
ncbi:MAG: reverse transcriptase family protein [Myxococcales bacterium]